MAPVKRGIARRVQDAFSYAAFQSPVVLAARALKRFPPRANHIGRITGRTILITGASSGIGRAAALRFGSLGAHTIVVARRHDELEELCAEIVAAGGEATAFRCDLTDLDAVDALVGSVLEAVGHVDVLVNNAGRSIRRPVLETVDRFHDYERTMTLNYYSAVRLTLGLLPSMCERGGGHIVNVATWTVAMGAVPKFAAYNASKAALVAFGRSVGAELRDNGIRVTTVGFPLVRTPMIAPTKDFDDVAALSVDDAADWLELAVRLRPSELYPVAARTVRAVDALAPRLATFMVRHGGI